MALYFHEKKVAIEIVDDPLAEPVDRMHCSDYQVLQVTCDELADLESSRDFFDRVADALGEPRVERTPAWLAANKRLHGELFANTPRYW